MTKPILLTVDDDPQVLRAVARDLRRRYGKDYSVLRADSGGSALEALAGLKERGDPVALVLSDHRKPEMQGVELLGRARELYADAKRVLLTAYADTEAAIAAINESRRDLARGRAARAAASHRAGAALRAQDPGRAAVLRSRRSGRRAGREIETLTDDGAGIPEAAQPRIFEPFFTTKAVGEGTGLGLDLVQRIIQQHGGEITFSSEPGRTAFSVRLPVSPRGVE